jgi:hypothetical protein
MTASPSIMDTLVRENTELLDQFRAKGADLLPEVELHFICEMADETMVALAIEALQARFETEPLPRAASNARFAVCTDEDESYWEMILTVDLVLDACVISAIEHVVRVETEKLGGNEVAWGFADPRSMEMDRVQ